MFVVTVLVLVIVIIIMDANVPPAYKTPMTQVLLSAAAFAGYMMISALLSNGAVHLMVKFFIGEASLRETYHTLIPIQTGVLAVFYGATVLPVFDPNYACAAPLIGLAAAAGGCYWMAQRLADLHNIGLWQGCAALIIGPILLAILTAIGFALILSAMMPMIMAMPT